MKRLLIVTMLTASSAASADEKPPTLLDVECDPLTFANSGYGCQVGVRPPALHGVRISVASFSLHVPDVIAQVGNDGFDERVRPSIALYVLYYVNKPGANGFTVGGSMRYLRLRFEHDDEMDARSDVGEVSPEAIAGYQWHPFRNGFYLQPWIGLGVVLWRTEKPVVNGRAYDELPVVPFFTVNVGYEHGF